MKYGAISDIIKAIKGKTKARMVKTKMKYFNESLGNSQRYKAFTLAEIMIALAIIAVVASATIAIAKSRNDYVNKFMSYAAVTNIRTVINEMVANGTKIAGTGGSAGTEASGCHPTVTLCQKAAAALVAVDGDCGGWDERLYYCSQSLNPGYYVLPGTAAYGTCVNMGTNSARLSQLGQIYSTYATAYYAIPAAERTSEGLTFYSIDNLIIAYHNGNFPSYSCPASTETICDTPPIPPTEGTPDTITKAIPSTASSLCSTLTEFINTLGTPACEKVSADAGPFIKTNANFVTTNGQIYYLGADPIYIGTTTPYVIGTGTDYANEIYTIYLDIDGSKGNSTLNKDVIKFYMNRNGSIIVPDPNSPVATDTKYLSARVRYKAADGKYVTLLQAAKYKDALCKSGTITTTFNNSLTPNYCSGVTADATSVACNTQKCEVLVNKPGF